VEVLETVVRDGIREAGRDTPAQDNPRLDTDYRLQHLHRKDS